MRMPLFATALVSVLTLPAIADPVLLDDQFELPPGFHIYRAAEPQLTGGSYDLALDGQARLLVAEGTSIRRLDDKDGDGVYDSFETIASGPELSGRGPQGLLVYEDRLYAVAGDGVQLYSGYGTEGPLRHERRLGAQFNTGGDHAAHTVLRGLDGYVYLVTGDGGGTGGRRHITESSSPRLEERNASVFRFSPDGRHWECVASGGRNPPSLGMNYLGEFFSFDSDMEFHVDVPFYRPVRLNHWASGSDLGWQQVGAYPPWYIDCLPGVLDVGRGSPNWGVFYEHTQFPERYRNAFIVCDYRWKSATSGRYATSGRLVTFHLKRAGATWKAKLTELARARPGAQDAQGRDVNFGLVDVTVAPDGSLLVTDHSQGVWRIFYDASQTPTVPPLNVIPSEENASLLDQLLTLPQPAEEWSRTRESLLRQEIGPELRAGLMRASLDAGRPTASRLRAIRLLAPEFRALPARFLVQLATQSVPEVRGQAAWLLGLRGEAAESNTLVELLSDPDPFVRRRSAEALARLDVPATGIVTELTDDEDPYVRYAAMTTLSHRPTAEFFEQAMSSNSPQTLMRVLVAAHLRKERAPGDQSRALIHRLLQQQLSPSDQLNLLRVLSLYRGEVNSDKVTADRVREFLLGRMLADEPELNRRLRWEQARLLGEYKASSAFPLLVKWLVNSQDHVEQFHYATALAELPVLSQGWDADARTLLTGWLISTQTGWFAEYAGKGLQFPQFWATTLNKLAAHHADALATRLEELAPDSQLSKIVFSRVGSVPNADATLIAHYRKSTSDRARESILSLLAGINTSHATEFLEQELTSGDSSESVRRALFLALRGRSAQVKDKSIFLKQAMQSEDSDVLLAAMDGLAGAGLRGHQLPGIKSTELNELKAEQAVSFRLLELMDRYPEHSAQFEQALIALTGTTTPRLYTRPQVIWDSTSQEAGDQTWFARSFRVTSEVSSASMILTCDNEYVCYLNGKKVAASKTWEQLQRIDVSMHLRKGSNLIALECRNQGGPAGLLVSLSWKRGDGSESGLATDASWKYTKTPPAEWKTKGSTVGTWQLPMDVSQPTKNVLDAWTDFSGHSSEGDDLAAQEFWNQWYVRQYGSAFVPRPDPRLPQRPDAELHRMIVGMEQLDGNAESGRALYLRAGCYACHGGIADRKTTIFGPALNGVTLRLKRKELADAIVYPSKDVVERFRASVVVTDSGRTLAGFITEKSDEFVSVTDLRNNVTRIPAADVEEIVDQKKSLMPDRLLSRFSDEQIRDLLAFLASLK